MSDFSLLGVKLHVYHSHYRKSSSWLQEVETMQRIALTEEIHIKYNNNCTKKCMLDQQCCNVIGAHKCGVAVEPNS